MAHKYRIILLLAVVFTGLHGRTQTPVGGAIATALQHKLDSCVNAYDVPGISATLLLPGDRFWNGAAGVADIYTNEPMDTAYLFQQASVTKLFTATVVMQLVDEGLLSLNDTVGSFLPPMTYVPGNILVRNLLKHRSGLADLLADPAAANSWLLNPNYNWDPFTAIQTFGDDPVFPQGTAFAYSNTNYVLLGMIVEAVTGMPLHEVYRTRLIEPLGLTHTSFRPLETLNGTLVPGWSSLSTPNTYTDDMSNFLGPCYASMVFGAGAMVSTPWDVAHLNRALFSGSLLSPEMMDTMRTCTNVNMGSNCNGYGFGTMRYVFSGRTYFGHAGDINGFTQLTVHSEPDSITLTLSINRNDAPRGPIAAALLNTLFQQLSVGIAEEQPLASAFSIYPNPANDEVNITWNGTTRPGRIDLIDATGRAVRSERSSNATTQHMSVNGLARGPYIVRVVQGTSSSVHNLILQ